jgi:hypothetical protein
MNLLLITAALALGAAEQPAGKGAARLDGKWLIVYAEEGGRRNNTWEQRLATVADGSLSYEGEGGKRRSLRLKIGPNQTLEATAEEKGKAWRGVYILGQDYLCISLSRGGKDGAPGAGAGGGHGSSGDFILILRRARGKAPAP